MQFQLQLFLSTLLRPQAYLDPNSGSILVQWLLAGLLGAGFLIRIFWKKIKGLFTKSESKITDLSETNKEDDTQILE